MLTLFSVDMRVNFFSINKERTSRKSKEDTIHFQWSFLHYKCILGRQICIRGEEFTAFTYQGTKWTSSFIDAYQ